ncbi:MAG: hypothetical protein H7334_00810 [Ferruginibacter sp.]|nr:hypothetical protein [Ferruginibacter sp.]
MAAIQIRESLHEYIDTADEKKLEAIYTVLKDSITENYEYNNEELATLYARRNNYKAGNESTLTTEEFLSFLRTNKAAN